MIDRILEAMEAGTELPSPKLVRGANFGDVQDEVCFGDEAGVQFIDQMRLDRLHAIPSGRAALKAVAACHENDEDDAHWSGPHGELLEAILHDDCRPRIDVVQSLNPFNPVALLTPPSMAPLAAVAAENIRASEPIALYLGDLITEDDDTMNGTASNTYLYELSLEEMRARGYKGSARLRVDASKAGAEARFINDKWAPGGLPPREPNCYVELLFEGETKQFLLVFFASKRIPKGKEIIADYGPDYWKVASEVLLREHEQEAARYQAAEAPLATVQSKSVAKKKQKVRQ